MKKFVRFPSLVVVLIFLLPSAKPRAQNPTVRGSFDGDMQNTDVQLRSTGQTTGHIANIMLTNTGKTPLTALSQTVYIPSSGQYQPYVGVIPGTSLPPGVTTTIPVDGFCVDIFTPPVPPGEVMPPIDTWIPVGDPNASVPDGSVNIVPTQPESPFSSDDIPSIISSPHFNPAPPIPEADIIITWPGTDIPVGGTFDPDDDPTLFGPVLTGVLNAVEHAIDNDERIDIVAFNTPFSSDPPKEREAIIQHVIWIYAAALSGKKYEKENFTKNVYDQFQDNTGITVVSLPGVEKEKLDDGIDDFWNTFTAVGKEAKILSKTTGN